MIIRRGTADPLRALGEGGMARLTHKLWVGIGCVVITAAPSGGAAAQAGHPAVGAPAAVQAGAIHAPGDGGEAYLNDGGPTDTRIRFFRDIELMRGHLLVGGQLIADGLWEEALPHFLHPTEELYGRLEKHIALHGIRPFRRELLALAQAVKARRTGAYEQALAAVEARLGAALDVARRFMNPLHVFAARSAVEVLRGAAAEYHSALEGGRFVRPVEYQDARGFVWRATAMFEENAAALATGNRGALTRIRATLATLKTAWPAAMPPAQPVLGAEEVARLVEDVARETARF
jgi:hypothetical protein